MKSLAKVKPQFPTGLNFKGQDHYEALVKMAEDTGPAAGSQGAGALCEMLVCDSVLEEHIAQGMSCVSLNKEMVRAALVFHLFSQYSPCFFHSFLLFSHASPPMFLSFFHVFSRRMRGLIRQKKRG